jgi:signal transduction histidine kinase
MESKIAAEQRAVRRRWLWVLALMGAVDAAAVGALIYLARRQGRMWRRLRSENRDRTREIAQIGAGLAHEVRNPLHALRINLHTLRRAFGGRATLPQEQLVATVEESNAAIERLDALMRDFLQFSDPTEGDVEKVDVVHEVRATLNLQAENLRCDQIEVRTELTEQPTPISIDPIRLRQSLHNLLTFAQHRAGKNGKIDVSVAHKDGGVEIAIEDSGPGLPELQRARIFEPFQAPAETGSGLGLALVQVHVEEAGGQARFGCNGSANGCRVWFPLATTANKGGES